MKAKSVLSEKLEKCTQWSKNQIIFQGGAGPKFDKFPSETYLVMAKYQKLAKSVEGN